MKEQTLQELKTERDVLLDVAKSAQEGRDQSERVIKLLIAADIVSAEQVDQARSLAKSLK